MSEAKWSDVTDASNLQTKAKNYLTGTAMLLSNTITVKAVNLHVTDAQIRSFRIYRNVLVEAPAHGVTDASFQLTELEIDIMNPQNTTITVGATLRTLVDINKESQAAADTAKVKAEAAQKAAEKAENAVGGLETRVKSAESSIKHNAEQIELAVKAEDVAKTLEDYYTATETDAAITVESDKIAFSVGEVKTVADGAEVRVGVAESDIRQLADMIATLVTDGNGASLMTQTEAGWTFSIAEIISKLDNTATGVDGLTEDVSGVANSLNTLKQAVNDLGVLADYVVIKTYNGQPCIELGEGDNEFKLRITNTEIQFADGTTIPAYINNKSLNIEAAEIKGELKIGGFVMKKRSNGNVGLQWIGA
jgi:hypothetical protein